MVIANKASLTQLKAFCEHFNWVFIMLGGVNMKISRVLTNNCVIIYDADGVEKIVCGKGIAYKKRPGDSIDSREINQVFTLSNKDLNLKFQQLLLEIPLEEIETANEIINYAKTSLDKTLDDSIYISLSDHIHMAVYRYLDGVLVKNAMLWDIKQFYSTEYEIGQHALKIIENRLGVSLPDDEAGFIAFHLVNASLRDSDKNINLTKMTQIIQEISNIVKYHYKKEFDVQSVYYYRFITHLRFLAQRLITKTPYDSDETEYLYSLFKDKHPEEVACTNKIASFLKKKYDYTLSEEEMTYLTVHIVRFVTK